MLYYPLTYEAAIEEAWIDPVSQPQLNIEKMEAEGAWVLTV